MTYTSVPKFLREGKAALSKGPVALVLMEDEVEAESTIAHHVGCGFKSVIAIGAAEIQLNQDFGPTVHRVTHDMMADDALCDVVNGVIAAAPHLWIYYCYNGEYLFYPFSEHRSVGELVTFSMEERRDTVMTFVIDLYAVDLEAAPNAVSRENAHLDKSGYYALARHQKEAGYLERQMDFFGGLRWRFEEHIPFERRRIDRVGLFRAKPGLKLRPDHTFNDPEYNTYACAWHNNLTAAICSFRTAKALKRNPGSAREIGTFAWRNSVRFEWHSQQLMDLGLMETGQWF